MHRVHYEKHSVHDVDWTRIDNVHARTYNVHVGEFFGHIFDSFKRKRNAHLQDVASRKIQSFAMVAEKMILIESSPNFIYFNERKRKYR